MACTKALLSIFLLTPCDDLDGGGQAIAAAVAHPNRPAADVARDAGRKPSEVLTFFDIAPGMTVLEVFSGGGYYTQILDEVVGADGRLIAHNNQAYLDFVGAQFEARREAGHLPNTDLVIGEVAALEPEAGSLDAALLVLAWHDFLYADERFAWPDVDEAAFLDSLCAAMKPGAVLGIVDHVAAPGGDPESVAKTLHRIDPERVLQEVSGSCFELEAESAVLRNPDDDHSANALDETMAGRTDRFVYKFVRS